MVIPPAAHSRPVIDRRAMVITNEPYWTLVAVCALLMLLLAAVLISSAIADATEARASAAREQALHLDNDQVT